LVSWLEVWLARSRNKAINKKENLMRFISILICTGLLVVPGFAQNGASPDYTLTFDGVEYPLALGVETKIKLKSGAELPVTLNKKAIGLFATGDLSFEYPGQYTVASSVVDLGITQHTVITALGTVILVQNYADGLPAGLLNAMFEEMVDEPKAMGLPIERSNISRAISNGGILKGVRAAYKGADDDVKIDIATATSGGIGFLILTMNDQTTSPEEADMIEKFWKSVALKK
jgi:hypothetical protein